MAKRRMAKEWSTLVERWQRSGLAAKEFAAAEGLVASTLSWWKWHLRAKARSSKKKRVSEKGRAPKKRQAPKKRVRRARARDNAPIRLVELVAPEAAFVSETPVELVLGDDVVVRVRRGFDADTLRRLVAAFASEDTARC